jgi:Crp-like helix-turn-helix protein
MPIRCVCGMISVGITHRARADRILPPLDAFVFPRSGVKAMDAIQFLKAASADLVSEMLGVRRPSISTALQVLEGRPFIRSTRRLIVLLDLEGLARLARR